MSKTFAALLLLALAGCTGLPPQQRDASPCAAGEATWACQIERYNNVAVD
jgi:hypothetical protein